MRAIRCPQCGLINEPDDVSFPRCDQCHEDLVRCISCRHVKVSGCSHPRGQESYTADGEGAKECPHFRSRDEVSGPRMLWNIPAPVWVFGLLLLVLVSITAATGFIDPAWRYFIGNPLALETTMPQQATVGRPFIITMRITNKLHQASTRMYLAIDGQFLESVNPGLPTPEPRRISREGNRLMLEYDPLPAGGQWVIHLPFIPRWSGTAPFIAHLYAPSNQLRQEVNVPIKIVEGDGMVKRIISPVM